MFIAVCLLPRFNKKISFLLGSSDENYFKTGLNRSDTEYNTNRG